ncbi:MAG: sulfotransferase family protein [Geminicoccaceae bacterium]
MGQIIVLWAVPRSTSTAFEWMMRQRGDMTCFHEPFGEAWYQGEDPLWPRLTADSKRTPGLTLKSVMDRLLAVAESEPVFSKDFPHYVDHMWDAAFLSKFTHAFLIRDPAKTITSMYDKWPDFHEKEVGFAEQRALFDLIMDRYGTPPPVLDSDDLLEDPYGMVEAWCDAVGIPFLPEALSWEPGARDEVSWWDGGAFHANLRNSDGLKPQKRTYIDIERAPDRVKAVYENVRPHYAYMHRHRLQESASKSEA